MEKVYNLAFDLGASSGRLMLGIFDGETIALQELHRFPNEPVFVNGTLMWDIYRLLLEMKEGLKKAAALKLPISGIGIDTWGVDYGLLDAQGNLIAAPVNYRDARNLTRIDEASGLVPLAEIYASTGIQFMPFNTVFQLLADKELRPVAYANAQTLLFMPDLLAYFLTDAKACEYTIASTSQMLDAEARTWDKPLLERLGLRTDFLPGLTFPGTVVGMLSASVQAETGLGAVPVVAVGSHDTASAVAGTPLEDANAAYLSCGTWSLLGVETGTPIISEDTFQYNFTNEGGVENTIRFLKNINGLWILQQLRKSWNAKTGENLGFGEIVNAARAAANKSFAIDPSDPAFVAPQDMAAEIAAFCKTHGQGEPNGIGEHAMAVYNGLTKEYKTHVDTLAKLVGHPITMINMIGGGIQDELLCEMTARVTGRTICAGPIEGSVLGNLLMQLKAGGHIVSLAAGRAILKRSFAQKIYKGGGI